MSNPSFTSILRGVMRRFVLLLFIPTIIPLSLSAEVNFVHATDLYYGQEFSKQFNHQLWITTKDLVYDPISSTITGSDGDVLRLDLMCPSATNIAGTYEIVGPAYADAPYKLNKKYTYWTYFEEGAFIDKKLTIGTCTIACTSVDTYTIKYDVQDIDNGNKHVGTIKDIHIQAVTSARKPYQLVPECTNITALQDVESSNSHHTHTKMFINGRIYVRYRDPQDMVHIYDLQGQEHGLNDMP